jgi:hypothetical protein
LAQYYDKPRFLIENEAGDHTLNVPFHFPGIFFFQKGIKIRLEQQSGNQQFTCAAFFSPFGFFFYFKGKSKKMDVAT